MEKSSFNLDKFRQILVDVTAEGSGLSAQGLSLKAGLGKDAVRDILRGASKNPSADTILNIMRVIGRDLREIIDADATVMPLRQPINTPTTLTVKASVAAGVWKEHVEWPADEWYEIEVMPSRFGNRQRFALRMEGQSMNKTIPSGSDLECLRAGPGLASPEPGDLVIVQRTRHDLAELTCKRLDIVDDQWVLRAESTEPQFAEPLFVGSADRDLWGDEEIRVIGIVVSAQQRHFRGRL